MKFLILALALTTSGVFLENQAYAQSHRAVQRPDVSSRIGDYCTTERFNGYALIAAAMRDYVSPQDYARIYLPLKVKATKASVVLKHFGPLSATTNKALLDIVKFVDANQGSFDALWEVEAFNAVAQDLMDLTVALTRDLE